MFSKLVALTAKLMSGQRLRNCASVAGIGAGEITGDGDAHGLRRRLATAELRDLIVDRQHPARLRHDHLAARREADTRCALVEQLVTEEKLQSLDLRAHRRLSSRRATAPPW